MTERRPSCGVASAQSLNPWLSRLRSGRLGARFQGTNVAPTASASARLHASLMKRTRWPRATSFRTTSSVGVTLPPPSQRVKRKRMGTVIVVSSWSRARELHEHGANERAHGRRGGRRALLHVPTKELPDVYVGCDYKRVERAL